MPEIDPVILRLQAEVRDYNAKVDQARRRSDQQFDAMEKRANSMSAGIGKAFSFAAKATAGYLASVSALGIAREYLRIADSAKSLEAQLKLATRESGSFAQAQDDVRRIAATTRSGLEETAKLYGNFARNARELGITQIEAGRATETVAKTFKISGAATEETSQATRQLVQALQSGVLRGDEFNTMAEAAPRFQRLLADSLGVTVGQLRKMAEEGELTSAKLVKALTDQKFTKGIDEEFKALPVTFDEAMQQVENAAIVTFGAFDRGGQFSTAIANFVTDGSRGFADLEAAAERFGINTRSEISALIALFDSAVGSVQNLIAAIGNIPAWSPLGAIGAGANAVGGDGLSKALRFTNPLGMGADIITNVGPAAEARDKTARELALQSVLRGDPLRDFGGYTAGGKPRPVPASGQKAGGRKTRGSNEAQRIADRQDSELARLQADELRARFELSTDTAERADLAKQMLEAEREELIRRLKAAKALTPEIASAVNRLYGETGSTGPDGIKAEGRPGLLMQGITREMEERQARLANDMLGRQADTLDAWAGIETNTKKRNELEKAALDLHQKIERNLLEQEVASGNVADAEKANAELASQQAAARERLRQQQMSPLQRYSADLQSSAENINDALESIQVDALDSLNDGLVEAIMGTKSLGDVFKSVASQIVADLLRIAVQKAVIGGLASALGGGGLGSLFGGNGMGSAFNNSFDATFGRASGGHVNAGQMYRVNEGSSPGRVEAFVPQGSGDIIPLGRMNAMAASSGGGPTNINVTVNAKDAVLTHTVRQWVAEGVQQATVMGSQIGAGQAEGRMMSRSRRRLPG